MAYADLLKDPRWQRARLEALNAADWECSSCGERTKTLHVHHKRYVWGRKPWEYTIDELAVLCVDCHERITLIQKRFDAAVAALKLEGDEAAMSRALGVIEAALSPNVQIQVLNLEHAEGIALTSRVAVELVTDAMDASGEVVPVHVLMSSREVKP